MRKNLSEQSKEFISSVRQLRKTLAQVLPADIVDYIVKLVVNNGAHEKLLKLTEEDK